MFSLRAYGIEAVICIGLRGRKRKNGCKLIKQIKKTKDKKWVESKLTSYSSLGKVIRRKLTLDTIAD